MPTTTYRKKQISFVIPCLNEAKTLPFILKKITEVCSGHLADYETEIVLSDNGSTDNSIEIAIRFGARIISCSQRGYGAALQTGIAAAHGEIVIFADADDTYDFLEAPALLKELEQGYDLVIGDRLHGNIEAGAMPFLHKHLGTPILTFFINLIFNSNRSSALKDCNSGFRCFRKNEFMKWNVESKGMEFASEMLIKALKNKAQISHIPISLSKDHEGRIPTLKTWQDGMRHLLQIFLEAPHFFFSWGISLWSISWLVLLIGFIWGATEFGQIVLFGIHTMMFASLGSYLGLTIWSMGLFLSTKQSFNVRIYDKLINLKEDKLLWLMATIFSISGLAAGVIILQWCLSGFHSIYLEEETLFFVVVSSNGILITVNLFTAHLLKKVTN